MADSAAVTKVRELARPLCEDLGLFLWDVKLEKEGANRYLRVYIDCDGGVGIDDCEALHRPLDKLLDEYDPVPGSYVFEVCSPGLGRKLERPEHFEVCMGDPVKIGFYTDRGGSKELFGILDGYDGSSVTVDANGHKESFALSECRFVRLDDDRDLFSDPGINI